MNAVRDALKDEIISATGRKGEIEQELENSIHLRERTGEIEVAFSAFVCFYRGGEDQPEDLKLVPVDYASLYRQDGSIDPLVWTYIKQRYSFDTELMAMLSVGDEKVYPEIREKMLGEGLESKCQFFENGVDNGFIHGFYVPLLNHLQLESEGWFVLRKGRGVIYPWNFLSVSRGYSGADNQEIYKQDEWTFPPPGIAGLDEITVRYRSGIEFGPDPICTFTTIVPMYPQPGSVSIDEKTGSRCRTIRSISMKSAEGAFLGKPFIYPSDNISIRWVLAEDQVSSARSATPGSDIGIEAEGSVRDEALSRRSDNSQAERGSSGDNVSNTSSSNVVKGEFAAGQRGKSSVTDWEGAVALDQAKAPDG